MKKRNILIGLVIGVLMFNMVGCKSSSPSSNNKKSIEQLNREAEVAIKEKDYDKAQDLYYDIVNRNNAYSLARYGLARVAFLKRGIDLVSLISQALQAQEPELDDINIGVLTLKKMYDANNEAIKHLRKIADGKCDGVIPAYDLDVNISLAIMQVLQGVLLVLDTNGDQNPATLDDFIKVIGEGSVDISLNVLDEGFDISNADFSKLDRNLVLSQVRQAIVYFIGASRAQQYLGEDFVPYTGQKGAIEYMGVAINASNGSNEVLNGMREGIAEAYEFEDANKDRYDLKSLWEEIKYGDWDSISIEDDSADSNLIGNN